MGSFFKASITYLAFQIYLSQAGWLLVDQASCKMLWAAHDSEHHGRTACSSSLLASFPVPTAWFSAGGSSVHQQQLENREAYLVIVEGGRHDEKHIMRLEACVIPLLSTLGLDWDSRGLFISASMLMDDCAGNSSCLGFGIILSGGW